MKSEHTVFIKSYATNLVNAIEDAKVNEDIKDEINTAAFFVQDEESSKVIKDEVKEEIQDTIKEEIFDEDNIVFLPYSYSPEITVKEELDFL